MQFLFSMDIQNDYDENNIDNFLKVFITHQPDGHFFSIIKGVVDSINEIDSIISKFSLNWKLPRIACVDRNILRIALFEMLYCEDVPNKVAINEAIEIAKKYGSDESSSFINGILDSVNKTFQNGELRLASPRGFEPLLPA